MLLILVASFFRFHALGQAARFHPDEALFSAFARQAAVNGDWLLLGALDKPPLTIYVSALAMTFFGVQPLDNGVLNLDIYRGEFAARVPGTFASILLIPILYALAKQVYRNELVGVLTLFFAALSPFAIAFSATAFTDGLMLLGITLALWLASAGRWFSSGLWLALGLACKQQALLYLPLLLAVGWYANQVHPPPVRSDNARWFFYLLRFMLPLVLVVVLLLVWDAVRQQPTSMWSLAVANNDPSRLVRPDELLPRLLLWLTYGGLFLGPGGLTALLALTTGIVGFARARMRPRPRVVQFDLLLVAYLLVYFLVHWLIALNIYDRYLLPLLPPALLLFARGAEYFVGHLLKRLAGLRPAARLQPAAVFSVCVCLGVLVLCFFSALEASEGRIPVGGDQGKHTGIDELSAYLNAKPLGTIVYDHWLGWELSYYLGSWSDKRRVYYPTPQALAADARLQPDPAPRYFVAPASQAVTPWLDALQSAGFAVSLDYATDGFVAYRLIPP